MTCCQIGERSSHTWFVLKCLPGYPGVWNYDGSWTEWGNLSRAPFGKPREIGVLKAGDEFRSRTTIEDLRVSSASEGRPRRCTSPWR